MFVQKYTCLEAFRSRVCFLVLSPLRTLAHLPPSLPSSLLFLLLFLPSLPANAGVSSGCCFLQALSDHHAEAVRLRAPSTVRYNLSFFCCCGLILFFVVLGLPVTSRDLPACDLPACLLFFSLTLFSFCPVFPSKDRPVPPMYVVQLPPSRVHGAHFAAVLGAGLVRSCTCIRRGWLRDDGSPARAVLKPRLSVLVGFRVLLTLHLVVHVLVSGWC